MERDAPDFQNDDVNVLLREGIQAARSGQRERACSLLMRVVDQDEDNATAWLWLSGVVDSLEDREICLENVLTLDPGNDFARRGLEWVRQQTAGQPSPSDSPVDSAVAAVDVDPSPSAPVPESPMTQRVGTPVSPASAMLREDFARRQPPPEPEPETPPAPASDEFDDEYLCPYCAAPTEPDQRRCKACGGNLWIRFRRREKPSTLLWIVIGFQLFATFQLAAVPFMLLIYVGFIVGVFDPLLLLNAYLGIPGALSPEVVSQAFGVIPRFVFFASALPFLFSLSVLVALYFRWKPVYYLMLVDGVWGLLSAVVAVVMLQSIIGGVIGVGLALARVMMVFQLEDDFAREKRRILLRPERGLGSSGDFLARARFYSKQRMYAMAVIHLRRAVSRMPSNLDCRISLAVAYVRIKRYDLAARQLEEARAINPDDPRVEKLAALLDEIGPGDGPA